MNSVLIWRFYDDMGGTSTRHVSCHHGGILGCLLVFFEFTSSELMRENQPNFFALRFVEINKAPLAQHCFIRAVVLENNSAISWSNLGLLYLQLGDIQLANEAFQAAQRADPKYPRSWIGQVI